MGSKTTLDLIDFHFMERGKIGFKISHMVSHTGLKQHDID